MQLRGTIRGDVESLTAGVIEGESQGAPASPPVNLTPPSISGLPQQGQILSASTGAWTNSPTGYTYRWFLDGTPIGGATSSTYLVDVGAVGGMISSGVTASNGAGAGSEAVSAEVGPVTPVGAVGGAWQFNDAANSLLGVATGVW